LKITRKILPPKFKRLCKQWYEDTTGTNCDWCTKREKCTEHKKLERLQKVVKAKQCSKFNLDKYYTDDANMFKRILKGKK